MELDVAEIGGVVRQIDVVVAAAVEEVEHESWDPASSRRPQIVDGGIAVVEGGHAGGSSPGQGRVTETRTGALAKVCFMTKLIVAWTVTGTSCRSTAGASAAAVSVM